MKNRKLICVILAAGKGTRMQSDLPKVLHTVAGVPMLTHVIRAAESLVPDQIRVVTGPGQDNVAAVVPRTHTLVQNVAQMGTGYAVRAALEGVNLAATDVLILFGDVPLVPHGNLRDLYARHTAPDAPAVTILAMTPDSPRGYGRLVTDAAGRVLRVVEELDATEEERQITLCSSGMMILRGEGLMDHLSRIENKNAKGEYYLLDILPFVRAASGFAAYAQGSAPDLKGVNDPTQLQEAQDRYTTLHRSASAQPRRA